MRSAPADTDRPFWQSEPCPTWCGEGHADHDHPADRVHASRWSGLVTMTLAAAQADVVGGDLVADPAEVLVDVAQGSCAGSVGSVSAAATRLAAAWCVYLEKHAAKVYDIELLPGAAAAGVDREVDPCAGAGGGRGCHRGAGATWSATRC